MKKWIVAVISLLVIAAIVVYYLIPSPQLLSNQIGIRINSDAAYRVFGNQQAWDRAVQHGFKVNKRLLNTIELTARNEQHAVPVTLLFIPVRSDSVLIKWQSPLPSINGIFSRWKKYSLAISLRDQIKNGLSKMAVYVQNDRHVYGFDISETSTTDTFLIATRFKTSGYPSLTEIDTHVQQLKEYALKNGAQPSGYPMLNATDTDSGYYRCMIALPINKIIETDEPVFFVRMVPGKFLTAEVTGGPHTIAYGHAMMQQYFKDYNRISMAIPFEYMVTDRLRETDTTRWITRIYGPVY